MTASQLQCYSTL